MSTQEERERMAAFASVIGNAENRASYVAHQGCAKEAELIRADIDCLRGCIPVPREEYERMERALWVFFPSERSFAQGFLGGVEKLRGEKNPVVDLMVDLGFWEQYETHTSRGTVGYRPTHAAHEFAARMKEKK